MTYKEFINQVLIVFIVFFLGLLFSSFIIVDSVNYPDWYLQFNMIIRENWEILALIVSEIAALLPGKPKGIIHAVIEIGNKIKKSQSNRKKGGYYEN